MWRVLLGSAEALEGVSCPAEEQRGADHSPLELPGNPSSEWQQDCTQHLCRSMIFPVHITVNSLSVPSFWQGPPVMLRNLFGGFLPKELPVSEQRAITHV